VGLGVGLVARDNERERGIPGMMMRGWWMKFSTVSMPLPKKAGGDAEKDGQRGAEMSACDRADQERVAGAGDQLGKTHPARWRCAEQVMRTGGLPIAK